jgi:hypothetical protein
VPLASAALALGLAGCSIFGSDRGQVDFTAPGLSEANRSTVVRSGPDNAYEEEIVRWRRSWNEPPTAHIIRRTLNPGHKFVQVPELKDFVSGFGKTASARSNAEFSDTALGRVDHRIFRLGEIDCLGFRGLSGGTFVIGYYCAPPGITMTQEQARVLVHSLKVARRSEPVKS